MWYTEKAIKLGKENAVKRILILLAILSLALLGLSSCKSQPLRVPTCEELVAAYEAEGYHTWHHVEDGDASGWRCCVKVWGEDENDYAFFHFFDSAEAARAYDGERDYNLLIYAFSVIFGDWSWLHTKTCGNIEYEYVNAELIGPFEALTGTA